MKNKNSNFFGNELTVSERKANYLIDVIDKGVTEREREREEKKGGFIK